MNTGPLSHSSRSVPQIPHHLTWSCSSPGPRRRGRRHLLHPHVTPPMPPYGQHPRRLPPVTRSRQPPRRCAVHPPTGATTGARSAGPRASLRSPSAPACTAPPFLPALSAGLARRTARKGRRTRSVYHEHHDPENRARPGTRPAHPYAVHEPPPGQQARLAARIGAGTQRGARMAQRRRRPEPHARRRLRRPAASPMPRHSRRHCCVVWRVVPHPPHAMTARATSPGIGRPEPAGRPGRPRRSRPHSRTMRDPGPADHRECRHARTLGSPPPAR